MKRITLTQNKSAIVDDEDYERLSLHTWCYDHGYARSFDPGYMHRFIVDVPKDKVIDHINGDGLDNRKANLRVCERWQNICNQGKSSRNTSGHKGVTWHKGAQKWMVELRAAGRRHYLGLYVDLSEAAKVYQDATEKYHGEFAYNVTEKVR